MACIDAHITRVDRLDGSIKAFSHYKASILRADLLKVRMTVTRHIVASLGRLGRVGGHVAKICTPGGYVYLVIEEDGPFWVTPEMPVTIHVSSNTLWNVE